MKTEFKEVQKFIQGWLWFLLIVIAVLPFYLLYKQLFNSENVGSEPMTNTVLVVFSVFNSGIIGLFLLMRLQTEIDKKEIRMHYFPFVKKTFSWNEIKTAAVVDYGFVGGWGIRLWTKYGTVYNTKGSKGLAIELLNGKKFLIGTQKAPELKNIVEGILIENQEVK